jgi:glycosyltransferase involved in cell wall biosynthesis
MARILQVCNTDFYLARFLGPLVRALVADGHSVECVCEASDLAAVTEELGVVVHPLRFPKSASPLSFHSCIKGLRGLIRGGNYDCVNSHNRNASIAGRIAAWLEHVPLNLYTAHGFYFHDGQRRGQREATIWLERALARITTFTLSQSEEDVRLMVRRGYIAPERIARIGNGIDTSRFRREPNRRDGERRLGLRSGPFRVGAVGRLVKGKGFLDLLTAFARLHAAEAQTELVIIGGNIEQDISPFHDEFMAQARRLGVDRALRVTGLVREVEAYLSVCDVFVLPSYREGMPRALLEAMSIGLPVIATDIRGCHEIVSHATNGFLYPPRDIDRLASLLGHLHENPALRRKLGQEARATVLERFDERGYVARQVEAIDRLLGARMGYTGLSTASAS